MTNDLISRNAIEHLVMTKSYDLGEPIQKRLMMHDVESLPSEQPEQKECILTIWGECLYSETGCSDCSIKNKITTALSAQPEPLTDKEQTKYEYHYDHTDCIWYRPEARNRCPTTCAQYRDGWNDAMNYIFRDGKGYRPYRRDKQYGE